ncbi:MAG: 3-oxoacyl-ACP reductase FabG [Pseudomonadota bacterium]
MTSAFTGQTVLVTGASRGIGKSIAELFVDRGAYVIGTATSDNGATSISEYLETNGTGLVLNQADNESIKRFAEGLAELNTPSILINNAGITRDNLMMRMKDEEWDDVIETNLSGVFKVTRLCLRAMMKARYGRIINITSVVGLSGNPGQTNYSATKAGVIGYTKSLAREVGSRGITVNAIAPGFIETDMTDELSDDLKQTLLKQIVLGRLGQADEIAKAVAFLASAEAEYITGQTLSVNGGMYMG